ncbi:MAG: M48 family metallopeptidase, partial [Planctomycetota bacterium]
PSSVADESSAPEETAAPAPTETTPPTEATTPTVAQTPTEAEAADAKRYSRATLRCTLVDMALDIAVLVAMAIVVGPIIDRWLARFSWLGGEQSLARLAALGAVLTGLHSLVSLPLSYYAGFLVEHRFGLSTQSHRAWVANWLKKSALTLVLLTILYTGLFAIIWTAGSLWWLAAAVAFFIVSAVLGQLMPVVVLPLFYKVDPLDDDAHTQRMQSMATDAGLTIDGVYRLGMSAETTKANAMLAGIGATRRVLLGDTLLDEFTPAEIDIVFAHELGHHVHKHLPKLLAMAGATALAGFYGCHLVLVAWTGIADPAQWPVVVLPKVVLLLTLFSMLVGPIQNVLSRHFERQADRYAIDRLGDVEAFRSAFLKLARMNKADLDPDPTEVFLLHSHPPIRERLQLVGAAID